MINNRQGGRRRGRGGQRGQNLGGQPGNRQDNRQRGNAAQLLEKYKNLARDSQLAGDRVQTEYYLQYADHYFRVLGESRSRYEDQRRQRDDDSDDNDGDEDLVEAGDDQPEPEEPRRDRGERSERFSRRNRDRAPPEPEQRTADDDGGDEREARPQLNGAGETIPFDVLPPAIGRETGGEEPEEESVRPRRRRARAPRAEDSDGEVAPAA